MTPRTPGVYRFGGFRLEKNKNGAPHPPPALRPTVYPPNRALGSLSSGALSSRMAHLRYHTIHPNPGDISNELTRGTFLTSRDRFS